MTRGLIQFVLFTLFVTSCARVSSPQGGPEDDQPPILVSSIPEKGQTNYQSQTILLTFDESVQTRNIESDIIITPRLQTSFKTRVKKNVVELEFFEPFNDNTTYSIGLGSTIRDITNNNEAQNINLSFSTGPTIDSLTVSGNIRDLLSQDPREDAIVALYGESDTTDILNGIASYFAFTDSSGNYQFNNLPSGRYRIYATNDKNGNNKADSQNEKYGFYTDTLDLNKNLQGIDLTVQNLNTTELRRTSARHFGEYFDIEFNKAILQFDIESPQTLYNRPEGVEKIRFYRNDIVYGDTTEIIYHATDSLGQVLTDTVGVYFQESRIEKDDVNLNGLPNRPAAYPFDTLGFRLSKPIKSLNLDSITITLDSLTVIPLNIDQFQFNQYRTEIKTGLRLYDHLTRQNPKLTITLGKGAFITADNDSSQKDEINYSFTELIETAVIGGTIITDKDHIIVQLVNANSKRVIRESNKRNYRFEYIPPGRYFIRVVHDRNNNGSLDVGNIFNNIQPEEIKYYYDNYYETKLIEVRENWESTADIQF